MKGASVWLDLLPEDVCTKVAVGVVKRTLREGERLPVHSNDFRLCPVTYDAINLADVSSNLEAIVGTVLPTHLDSRPMRGLSHIEKANMVKLMRPRVRSIHVSARYLSRDLVSSLLTSPNLESVELYACEKFLDSLTNVAPTIKFLSLHLDISPVLSDLLKVLSKFPPSVTKLSVSCGRFFEGSSCPCEPGLPPELLLKGLRTYFPKITEVDFTDMICFHGSSLSRRSPFPTRRLNKLLQEANQESVANTLFGEAIAKLSSNVGTETHVGEDSDPVEGWYIPVGKDIGSLADIVTVFRTSQTLMEKQIQLLSMCRALKELSIEIRPSAEHALPNLIASLSMLQSLELKWESSHCLHRESDKCGVAGRHVLIPGIMSRAMSCSKSISNVSISGALMGENDLDLMLEALGDRLESFTMDTPPNSLRLGLHIEKLLFALLRYNPNLEQLHILMSPHQQAVAKLHSCYPLPRLEKILKEHSHEHFNEVETTPCERKTALALQRLMSLHTFQHMPNFSVWKPSKRLQRGYPDFFDFDTELLPIAEVVRLFVPSQS